MRDLLVGSLVSSGFAILVTFVSNNLAARFAHRAETIQQQFAILQGQPYPIDGVPVYFGAFQNRVFFPLLLQSFATLGGGNAAWIGASYLLLMLASAFGAFLAFFCLLRAQTEASPKLAAAGLGLLAYELVFTFNQGWEHPSDFPDVGLTSLLLWAAVAHRRLSLLLLTMLASLNRESSLFAGVLWCSLYAFRPRIALQPRELAFGAAVSGLGWLVVTSARWYFGGLQAVSDGNLRDIPVVLTKLAHDFNDLFHLTPSSWPILLLGMVLLPLVWLWGNRREVRERDWRLLGASAAIFAVSLVFGQISELRDFLTNIVVVSFVVVAVEARAARSTSNAGLNGHSSGSIAVLERYDHRIGRRPVS
jgi:hypothetical protein